MQFHLPTLFAVTTLVAGTVGTLLAIAGLQSRSVRALTWVGAGYIVAACGAALLALRGVLPAGAVAMLPGNPDPFPAGQQGEIYLTGLEKSNRVQLTWRDQRCEIDVAFPETADPLPQLGTFTCQGVKR